MATITCDKCNGFGKIEVEDAETPCEATLVIGHETIGCFGSRKHPGQLHMAILCDPCVACGGFDEHHETCGIYEMEPPIWTNATQDWFAWNDGDLTVTRAGHAAGQAWRDEYQPGSPWARKKAA